METQYLKPIGIIYSSLKNLAECPFQEHEGGGDARLAIFEEFMPAVGNINAGDELILLTWLHQADRTVLKCYPRNETQASVMGVFSTRSPDRPNPIGLHTVTVIERISAAEMKVFPLEVLDGTPVIDIKPVIRPTLPKPYF